MGRLLVERSIVPDRIVSSTAVRARTTAAEVAAASGFQGEIALSADLYLAAPRTYLEIAAGLLAETGSAMFVGHNPGIEELVELLTGEGPTMPTAALAWIRLPVAEWREVGPGTRGELLGFWRPKEL
jgi:phosphohistidine phosphatase